MSNVPNTRKPFDFEPWIEDDVNEDTGAPCKSCNWCGEEGETQRKLYHLDDCPIGQIEALEWAMHCLIDRCGYKVPAFPGVTFCSGCSSNLHGEPHAQTCARRIAEEFIGDRFK